MGEEEVDEDGNRVIYEIAEVSEDDDDEVSGDSNIKELKLQMQVLISDKQEVEEKFDVFLNWFGLQLSYFSVV